MRLGHADCTQQTNLASTFEHREQQRDYDANNCNDDGQAEQPINKGKNLVDLGCLVVDELFFAEQRADASVATDCCNSGLHLGDHRARSHLYIDKSVKDWRGAIGEHFPTGHIIGKTCITRNKAPNFGIDDHTINTCDLQARANLPALFGGTAGCHKDAVFA